MTRLTRHQHAAVLAFCALTDGQMAAITAHPAFGQLAAVMCAEPDGTHHDKPIEAKPAKTTKRDAT